MNILKSILSVVLFLAFIFFGFSLLYSEQIEIVEVDLSSKKFKDAIPFDVPFRIKGKISKDVQKVEVEIKIVDERSEKNDYFQQKKQSWNRITDEEWFMVTVNRLRPNLTYEFKFNVYIKFGTGDDAEKLRKELFKIFYDGLQFIFEKQSPGVITEEELKDMEEEFNLQIPQILNRKGELINEDGSEIVVGLSKEPFEKIRNKIVKINAKIENFKKQIEEAKTNVLDYFKLHPENKPTTAEIVYELINQPDLLSPTSKRWWNMPLNHSLENHKSTEMSDIALIVADSLSREIEIINIFEGRAKIVGKSVLPATKPDVDSLQLIHGFFYIIKSKAFRYKNNQPVFKGYKDQNNEDILPKITERIGDLIKYIKKKDKASKEQKNLVNEFPNILTNTFLLNTYTIEDQPIVRISSDQSPYFSLDLGIAYAFDPKISFTYAGVNFYFVPINKKAPLKVFKGFDRFLKSFSLLLGLTTTGIAEGANKNLFSAGSVVMGAGYRITDILKVNSGWLIFKQEDENPLIDALRTKFTFFASISFDINIKATIGKLGSLF